MKTQLSIMKNSKIYPTGIRVKKVITFIQRLFSGLKENQIGLKLSILSKNYAIAALAVAFLFFGNTEKTYGQFLTEDFSYTTGTLLSANGYSAFSGAGTNSITVTTPGLSYPGSTASGVGNAVSFSLSGEDVGRSFTAVTSGSLYISYLAKFSAAQSGGDYCIAVSTGTFSAFALRLYVKSSGAGYVLGCSKGTGTIAYDGTIRNFSDTYQIVMKYTYNTVTTTDDIVDLWINPALGGTEGAPTISTATGGSDASAAGLTGFAIRQGGTTTAASGMVDGFKLGTTWASVTPAGVIPPVMTVSRTTFGLGNVQVGNSSASDSSYLVTGSNLTAAINLQFNPSTTVFEMSLTQGSGYTSTLSLTPDMSGSVSQTIYVRFSPSATGLVSSTIEHTSTGATQKDVALTGTGTNCSPPTITAGGPTDFCAPGSVTLTADAGASYLWSTTETTQSITVSTSGSYTVTVEDFTSCFATSAATVVNVSTFGFSGAIFSENVGNPGATIAMALYTGWQNQGILSFTSTSVNNSDVRISAPSSTSHYSTASGQGNVFLGTSGGNTKDFIIAGINTTGYTGLSFTFGLLRTLGSPNTPEEILVSVSTDGTTYTPLTTSTQPAFSTSTYGLVTVSSGIPATSNLRIKFSKTTNTSFRIDDMVLSGSVGSVSISASGPTSICAGTSVTLTSNVPGGNDWDPYFSFSQSITVNAAGTYATTVTDNQGCTATSNAITVSIVAAPSGVTSVTDVLCAGGSTGTASVVASGGAGGYTYSWDSSPVQTGSTATGLPAGTYTVTITDAGGCSGTASAIVAEPLPLQVTASSTKPTTIGGNDGTATGSAFDGTSPYSYSWDTSPIQNTDIATGLIAGTYNVTVTDANLCTASTSVTVVDPIPTITVSTTALADFGSVVVGIPSAEQSYTVSGVDLSTAIEINAPAGFEISETSGSGFGNFISLAQSGGIVSGTQIYVRFNPVANGATSLLITHTSTGATQKDVTVSGTGIPCAQATISAGGPLSFCTGGDVTLTASSGASYLWSTMETTQSIVVSTSGSYTVEVTDNASCVSTSSATVVTVSSFSYTGILFSENMGTPGGNTFVNSYTGWQNPGATFQSTLANQSDVRTSTNSAGAYTDASGGGNVFMGTAGGTDPRDFIISGINTLGYSGITLSFGMLRTAPDTLFVSVSSDGINYSSITTTQQPVTNNSWALVHDSIGTIPSVANLYLKFSKSTSTSFRIDDVTLRGTTNTFAVTANGPTTICSGKALVLTSNVGAGNDWSPFPSLSQSISVTTAGTYSCTVTDLLGCSLTSASFTVSVNPSPMVDTLISTNLLCNNDSSGTIEAVVSGGTTPYSYNWNSLPVQTTLTAIDLHSGFYTFTVTAANGCTASQGRFVSQPTPLVLSASVISHPTSIGASDGSIGSNASGGTTPYTYSWTGVTSSPVTISLNPTKDNNIFEENPSNSNATGPNFVAGNNNGSRARRALLSFDIASSVPAGATITSVSLDLNMVHTSSGAGAQDFDLHPLLENWGEGTSFDAGNPGNGVAATAGDATWINSFDPGTPWTTAGGEFSATSSATTSVDAVGVYTWSGSGMISDVQNWLDNPANDFGWLLKGNESSNQTAKRFDSRENATPANRPTLNITYTLPQVVYGTSATVSGLTAGIYFVTVTDSNACTLTATDTLLDPLPAITVTPTSLPAFPNTLVGNSSIEQTYTVSGIYLTDPILINAPTGFEISETSGSGFGSFISLAHTGGIVGPVTIYVHFKPVAGGTISPVITHESVGAVQKDVTVTGTGVTCSPAFITPSGPTTFCAGGSVTLTASAGDTYLWSNGETTASITTDTSGTFSVVVTDAFSCSSTAAPLTVTVNTFKFIGTIFSENMGSSGGTVALNTYTGWQNYGTLSFSTSPVGPSDVRISSGSPTPTFSGGSNVFLGTSGGNSKDFFIKGVNTMGYSNMVLSFGMLRTNTSEDLQVSVSSDTGQTYVALTTTTQPSGSTTVWGAAPIIASGAIPNSPNLYIKFSKSTSTQFRVDDVKLTGETSIVSITANGPTDFCQGSQVTLASNIPSLNLWSPGSETTKSIVVNSTGSYGLTATDGNGCTASAIPVTVNVNQIPVVNATATDVTCNAGTDGTATANVTAGTSPFTYSWNSSPVQTTQTATGLAAGTYKVVVTGAIGCKDSATAVVGEPTAIVANCSVVNHVTCNGGSDGATSVSGTGGTGVITVSGAATSGLTAGSYTYTLTDASGCSTTCTLVITEPAAIIANCSVVNHVTCNGGTDGATSVSGTGGTGTITVSGAPTTGLTAGSYMYTLTDASGCSTTCTVVITEPAAIVISSLSPSTGPVGTSVTISGSGFTGATDVQFNGLTTTYTVDNDGQISTTVPVGATTGPVTVLVGSCQGVSAGNFTVTTASGLDLDLRVFLEGYITEDWKNGFGGDTMRSTLYDLEQGTILTGPYSSTATDTIEVNLWTSASVLLDPNTTPPDYSEKVILNNNGRVTVNFATAPAGDYYIAVKHKNTIETWSSNLVTFAAGTTSYDFSTALTQAYDDGNNPPMATMPYGVFALYSGDNTQDGTVDSQDMNPVYNDNNAQLYDYLNTDCTGDGTTDSQDMNFVYNNSNLQLFYARPY